MAEPPRKQEIVHLADLAEALSLEAGPLFSILAAVGEGISMQDRDLRILYANEVYRRWFGDDVVGKYCWELYESGEAVCPDCVAQECFQDGAVSRRSRSAVDREGRRMETEIIAAPVRDIHGRVVAAVEVVRDISEPLRVQRELTEAAISISSGLDLDEVLNHVVRSAARVVQADAAMIALLDQESGDVVFPYAHNLPAHLTQVVVTPREKSLAAEAIRSGEPRIVNDYPNFPERRKEFVEAGLAAVATVPLRVAGRGVGVLGVMDTGSGRHFGPGDVDVLSIISTQAAVAVENANLYEQLSRSAQQLEQRVKERTDALSRMYQESERKSAELEKANLKLREVDRLKSEFLANMSHELRTPLNSIIGFSKLILDGLDGGINEEQHRDLEIVYTNAQELLTLIDDLLNLAKIEAGRVSLYPGFTDIGELVRDVALRFSSLAAERGLALKVDLPPGLRPRNIDEGKIRQVLINLLSNAIKFTDEGSVTMSVEQTPDETIFAVTDTGRGLKPEEIEQVFDRFHQAQPGYAEAGGVGLGLTISMRFVEMHGGRIWVSSTYGAGSSFYFSIPGGSLEPEGS